jgi:hypothetical protein
MIYTIPLSDASSLIACQKRNLDWFPRQALGQLDAKAPEDVHCARNRKALTTNYF